MIRYTLLRALIFFVCFILFYLLGLRGEENLLFLVLAAALSSMVISYFLLRPMREQFSQQIAHKIDERTAAKREERSRQVPRGGTDESAEDAEVDEGNADEGFR